jgi:site-specific DNA-methyltransferase (adenine-specific)
MQASAINLIWQGKPSPESISKAVLRRLRPGSSDCRLIHGDNLAGLTALAPNVAGSVALAYLDPPFFTGRAHHRVARKRDPETGKIVRSVAPAFDDRWDGLDDYLGTLYERIAAVRQLLAPHGCLVLHVDPKTSHYLKILCDEIFGPRAFASEIIWRYRRWPAKTKNFQRVHDVLLRYVRDPDAEPRFNQLYEPLAPSTIATWGTRKQRAVVDEAGHRRCSSRTQENTPGAPLGDVWEIGIVAPVARERTGYPTQKPEALLERIVLACTAEGDLVLDPYAGSGTTLAVAARLKRRVIGIDCSPEAVQVTRARLNAVGFTPLEQQAVFDPSGVYSAPGRRREVA